MFMEKIKTDKFKEKNKGFQIVYSIETIHPALKHKLSIGHQPIIYSKDGNAWFWVFVDDEYVMNPLSLPCDIESEDVIEIAKDIASHYIQLCQLEEIEDETNGIVPCDEMKGIQKTCDDCPQLRSNGGECIGPMWNHPNTLYLNEIEEKWKGKYGEGSKLYLKYHQNQMLGEMNQYLHKCGHSEDMMMELLEYMGNHHAFTANTKEALLEITGKDDIAATN